MGKVMIRSVLFLTATLMSIGGTMSARADNCTFAKIDLTNNVKKKSAAASVDGYRFELLGGDREIHVFEGPLKVVFGKKLACKFPDGIFERDLYYSAAKKYLITKTYSGSCGEFRVYDLKNCEPVGKPAGYCGNGKFNGVRLTNEPPCEPVGLGKQSCSMGKVFRIGQDSCSFVFDEKASEENTKAKLGRSIPLDETVEVDMPKPK